VLSTITVRFEKSLFVALSATVAVTEYVPSASAPVGQVVS